MTGLDLWTAVMAAVAGTSIFLRSYMLRPCHARWAQATPAVWISLSATAIALLMCAVSLVFTGHATGREALLVTVLAASGVIMLVNLHRKGQAAEIRKQEIADEVGQVLDLAGPPAHYPWEARR